jgi:histidinol-phosphate aminotransferase
MYDRISPHVKLVFICNPNNPTGTVVPPEKLRDFTASASEKAVIFIDEAYIELMEDMEANTMVDLVKKDHNVIVSRTFSKIFGMAGQRIGYALTRPDIARRIQEYRMGTPNVAGIRGAIASLQDEEFQVFSRARIAEGRQYVYILCDELGLKYTPSTTNFVFFHTGRPIQEIQSAMKDEGVLVGRPFPPYVDWCRISIGTMEDMQAFGTALKKVMA